MSQRSFVCFPLKSVFLFSLLSLAQSHKQKDANIVNSKPAKIAVIGGGIGGTSSAFYLHQLLGDDASITLFEKDAIGGRLATVHLAGVEYEIGGTIIHPRNMYMKKFASDFGFKHRKTPAGDTMGIFNGQEFLFQTSSWSVVTLVRMIWRYGLDTLWMNWTINELLAKFEKIYEYQEAGESYTTIHALLEAMGGAEFSGWLTIPIGDILREKRFSDRFIDELLSIATRANYGQNPDMMGFAGMVSLAGAMPGLWSIEGGNRQVPEELLKRSGATLVKSRIKSVERISNNTSTKPHFTVTWGESDGENTADFDIVIVATPLQDNQSGIQFLRFEKPITNVTGDYRRTVASLIKGVPKPSAFGVSSLPNNVITNVDIPLQWRTLANNYPVNFDPKTFNDSNQVRKIFSTDVLTDAQLDALFESRSDIHHRDWLAYPYYRAQESYAGFVLSEGVFYPNAVEWAASAMEMAIIGARNSALLASQYWTGESQGGREGGQSAKIEL